MNNDSKDNATRQSVVRIYEIGGMRYTVKAVVKKDAKNDAVATVRRLIRSEIAKQHYEN